MYRITVLYPREEGKRFDLEYYLNHHMPMVRSLLGPFNLKNTEVDQGLAGGGDAPPPFVVVAHLYFDDIDDFRRGMKEHGAAITADIPRYTDLKAIFQVNRML